MATHAGRTAHARTSLRSKRVAVALLSVAVGAALVMRTAGQPRPRTPDGIVTAGPEVDVSSEPGVQSQVSIAVDPTDDRVLVAGSGNWGRKTRAYSSTDGGSTWTASADPPLAAGVPQTCAFGDSTVGIDRLGRQYYAFIVGLSCDLTHIGSGVGAPELFVARRAGPTAPWTTPANPVAALFAGDALRHGEADDKPWLAVDVSPTSPHTNRVYVVWTRSGGAEGIRVLLSHTDDGAHTWSAPVRVNDHSLADGAITSVAVGPSGYVYVVWDDIADRTISIARSTDGGRHFGRTRLVANERSPRSASCDPPGTSIPAHPRRCVTADANVTVDNSSGRYTGRVYVSYADAGRNQARDVFVAVFDPALRPLGEKLVNPADEAAPSDQFQPAAAVDASTGTLWVCFYDTSGDPHRIRAVYSCTISSDGGHSWSRPVGAASVASDEAGRGANRIGYGDYQGLAVARGLAHPIWTDARALGTLKEEIYSATFTG
jgi:hypothetical protein